MGNVHSRPPADVLASGLAYTTSDHLLDESIPHAITFPVRQGPKTFRFPANFPSKRRTRIPPSLPHSALHDKSNDMIHQGGYNVALPATPTSLKASPATSEQSSTSSRPSTVNEDPEIDHADINGRKYVVLPGTNYHLPCDNEEVDRLVTQHFLLKHALDGNTTPPALFQPKPSFNSPGLDDACQVLDLGCGGGAWVLDMATEYPNAEFFGIDVRPMFPTSIKPCNTHFKVCNFIDSPLPFSDNTFDYVHIGYIPTYLSLTQLQSILVETMRVLKPMGFVELVASEFSIQHCGPSTKEIINDKLQKVLQQRYQLDPRQAHHLFSLLASQGFVDVQQRRVTIPLGWDGRTGDINEQTLERSIRSLTPDTLSEAGIDDQALRRIAAECKQYRSCSQWYVCYGQKSHTLPTPAGSRTHSMSEDLTWDSIKDFVEGFTD